MPKRPRDYTAKAQKFGLDPSVYGSDQLLAYKYIIKKYPDMPKDEAAEKALLFDEHSAQIFGYAYRRKIEMSLDEALSFKQHHKMAFIYAYRNNIDMTVNEVMQITSMHRFNELKSILGEGNYNKKDLFILMGFKMDKVPVVEEMISDGSEEVVESSIAEEDMSDGSEEVMESSEKSSIAEEDMSDGSEEVMESSEKSSIVEEDMSDGSEEVMESSEKLSIVEVEILISLNETSMMGEASAGGEL